MHPKSHRRVPRARHSQEVIFCVENYFLNESEICHGCPSSKNRLAHEHYHCLTCHVNIKVPKRTGDLRHVLKQHYINGGAHTSNPCQHSLKHPPRHYQPTKFEDLPEDEKTLVREGLLAFHSQAHGQSWAAQSCLNDIVSKTTDDSYQCGATKSAAINKGVYGERAKENLKRELRKARNITISFDGSTIHQNKLLPIFATFYDRKKGVCHRLLNLISLPNEKGKTIAFAIKKTCEMHKIAHKKIAAICADNCPTNFGSIGRPDGENVFAQLIKIFGHKIFGIGCLAHVINNAIKNATDHFDLGLVKLQEFLGFAHAHFEKEPGRGKDFIRLQADLGVLPEHISTELPLSYSQTRWLSLGPALYVIINNYDILEVYFNDNVQKCKHLEEFRNFFSNERVYPFLVVLWYLAREFEDTVRKIEGGGITLMNAIKHFNVLIDNCIKYRDNQILPPGVEDIIQFWTDDEKAQFRSDIWTFYDECQDYMKKWTQWTKPLEKAMWSTLDSPLKTEDVLESLEHLPINMSSSDIEKLKIQVEQANVVIEANIESWTKKGDDGEYMSTPKRWTCVFENVDYIDVLESLVEYVLCFPGTNATCERLFSEIVFFWDKWKGNLKISTVRTIMSIRCNYIKECDKMRETLIQDETLRADIRSKKKFKLAKLEQEDQIDEHFFDEFNPKTFNFEFSDNVDEEDEEEDEEESDQETEIDETEYIVEDINDQKEDEYVEVADNGVDQETDNVVEQNDNTSSRGIENIVDFEHDYCLYEHIKAEFTEDHESEYVLENTSLQQIDVDIKMLNMNSSTTDNNDMEVEIITDMLHQTEHKVFPARELFRKCTKHDRRENFPTSKSFLKNYYAKTFPKVTISPNSKLLRYQVSPKKQPPSPKSKCNSKPPKRLKPILWMKRI